MKTYPVFQDAVAYYSRAKGQFPLYITINQFEDSHPHYCNFVEFSTFIDGYGTEIVNGVPHAYRPGTTTLTLPNHFHAICPDPGSSFVKYCCMFSMDILSNLSLGSSVYHLLLKTGSLHPSFTNFEQESRHRIWDIFAEIKSEHEGDQIGRIDLIRTKLAEALLLFVRTRQQTCTDFPGQGRPETEHVILKVLPYLHLNYMNEGLTLNAVAEEFHVSSSCISNSIKKHTGQSFHDYILSLKVLSATSLLKSSELTISEIAAEVGFTSSRTFYRVFKKIKGETPDKYRST